METESARPAGAQPVPAHAGRAERGPGIVQGWRARRAAGQQARLISARNRRVLVRGLRRAAKLATDRDPIRGRHRALLHDRAAAVRSDLLAIAAIVEQTPSAGPPRGLTRFAHQRM